MNVSDKLDLPVELFDLGFLHNDELSAWCTSCSTAVEIGVSGMLTDQEGLDAATAHRQVCPVK